MQESVGSTDPHPRRSQTRCLDRTSFNGQFTQYLRGTDCRAQPGFSPRDATVSKAKLMTLALQNRRQTLFY